LTANLYLQRVQVMYLISSIPLAGVFLFHFSLTWAIPQGFSSISSRDNHTENSERADAVKAAFQVAWNGYQTYAFPHDELHPVDNTYGDPR
jgi:hypothetical protein